jgi:hypothetical protein
VPTITLAQNVDSITNIKSEFQITFFTETVDCYNKQKTNKNFMIPDNKMKLKEEQQNRTS